METAATETTTTEVNDVQAQAIIDALPTEKLTELLAKKGFVAKPEADYQSELNKAKKEAIDNTTKANYTSVEQTIFDATGIAKNAGEKVFDYQKRAFAEIQSKKEVEKEEVAAKSSDLERQYSEMFKQQQKEINALKEERKADQERIFNEKANGLIEGAFSTIKLNVADESEMAAAREEKEIIFKSKYEALQTTEGLAWRDKKSGEILMEGGALMKPEQIIKSKHPHWLAREGNQQTGLGLKGKSEKPSSIFGSTREEIGDKIREEAKKRNLTVTSPEMVKLRKEAYAAAGIAM